jgi:hypothetical protein
MMSRLKWLFLLLCLGLVSSAHGLLNDLIIIKSHTRVGYDSNVYNRTKGNETETEYLEQIVSLSALLAQSDRTLFNLMYSPKFNYRFLDDHQMTFQNFNTFFQRGLTPKLQLKSTYTYSVNEREPTSDLDLDADITSENLKTTAQLSYTPNRKHTFVTKYENKQKIWSENLPLGTGLTNGDYDQHRAELQYLYEVFHGQLFSTQSAAYTDHTYAGDRGKFIQVALGQELLFVLSPTKYLTLKGGYSLTENTAEGAELPIKIYEPFIAGGLNTSPFKNLTLAFNLKHGLQDSSIAVFNVAKKTQGVAQIKYNVTPKITTIASIIGIRSEYTEDYARNESGVERIDYLLINTVNVVWEINRNHAIELGYQGPLMNPQSDLGVLRNKSYMGYRLTF